MDVAQFKVPSEPRPMPSIGSDEDESFVVLGHGPQSSDDSPSGSPVGGSIVCEARSLISRELAALDKAAEPDNGALERSGALPEVPRELSVAMAEEHAETPLNTPISLVMFSAADLNSREVHDKITEVIDENIRLKDTILQNNMSMKLQYERIQAWREDVEKVHETHKQKFLEAKECIEKLKKEISTKDDELKSLKDKLDSVRNGLSPPRKMSLEQRQLEQTTNENMNQFELDVANKKVKELEVALEKLGLEKAETKEVDKTTSLSKELMRECDELKVEIDRLKQEVAKEKFAACETGMKLGIALEENIALKEEVKGLMKQAERAELERTDAMKLYSVEAERYRTLVHNYQMLEFEHKNLGQQLAQLQLVQSEQLQKRASVNSQEDIYMVRQQLMSSQAALTECQQGRAEALVKAGEVARELERLRAEVRQARTSSDEMFALQAQLDVYKADFEAERQSKEAMREERDRLAEDMQHMHRRNQQLQEQVERGGRPPVRAAAQSTPASAPPSEGFMWRRYKCPMCQLQFRSLRLVQDHLDISH